jgi:Na+-transporting methylmalonyl-CoA/oxaloacetate decarboxylase gamma subunit
MRIIFGVLSLLVVVAIVGVLAKKQLTAGVAPATTVEGVKTPVGTPQQQVKQFEQAVQGAMQQAPRTTPDDTK